MLRNEILEAIDNINIIETNSEISVMEAIAYSYEKQSLILENCDNVDVSNFTIFTESFDIKKGNEKSIIKTIINALKSFIRMIIYRIRKIISNITNKASTNAKSIESVSSILERVLESENKHNKSDDINAWPIPKINPKFLQYLQTDYIKPPKKIKANVVNESYSEKINTNDETVYIPFDPKSTIKGGNIKLASNSVAVDIMDDKTIKIKSFGFGKLSKTKVKESNIQKYDIPGQSKEIYTTPKLALYLMTHDDARKEITELVELALRVMKNRDKKDIDELNDEGKMSKLIKIYMVPTLPVYTTTFDQLSAVQSWASELLIKMEAFTSTDVDVAKFDKKTIKSLNRVVMALMHIQISLNFISSAMNSPHIINKSQCKTIKNLSVLDKFVGECIKAGLPPKYVAYNAWLASDECIRGTGEYKPIFGHARATLFPPNEKIVIKIALSGLGVVSNETEVRFTKIFKDMNRIDLIAPVIKSWKTNSIIAMERIKGDFDLSDSTCEAFAKDVDATLTEYQQRTGKKLNIKMGSQHVGNVVFDYKYNIYRSIDYGVHYRNI